MLSVTLASWIGLPGSIGASHLQVHCGRQPGWQDSFQPTGGFSQGLFLWGDSVPTCVLRVGNPQFVHLGVSVACVESSHLLRTQNLHQGEEPAFSPGIETSAVARALALVNLWVRDSSQFVCCCYSEFGGPLCSETKGSR
jgi:hypothetical protein